MSPGWVDPFVQTYGLWGLGLDVFLEAMGAPLPGETVLIVASGLAAAGAFDIRLVALVAFLGATLGDNTGYLIGRKFGRPFVLAKGRRIGITPERLGRVERMLDHRGAVVVVVARFFPLLRQLNGLAAGTAAMHWARFAVANALGAALWVGLWSWAAFTFGQQVQLLPQLWGWVQRFAWVVVPLLIVGVIAGWAVVRHVRRRARAQQLDAPKRLR